MKTKIFLSFLALGIIVSTHSQNVIELTLTAVDSTAYVQLDSIKVMNQTQGSDTVLFYPDTILVLDCQVGISGTNIGTERFQVFHNYPNPVKDQTTISFHVPERDKVNLILTDMFGRVAIKTERTLDQGYHSYRFTPGNCSLFLFTVQWRESSRSIKILSTSSVFKKASALEYIGSGHSSPELKATEDIQSFLFNFGDELLYIGYTDTLQSGKLDTPDASETYTFQFATNIPCPGTPTVTYEGQVYNTIQIFSQCWLKENLNVGTMIQGIEGMADNDTIEKYCFNNEPDSCTKYGALYQWDEMMQYTTQQGVQGICPPEWHLPSDEEWKVLEGAVDSLFGIGDSGWNISANWRGYNAGANLKTTTGWFGTGSGTDMYGFSALPGGYRSSYGLFFFVSRYGHWWSATEGNSSNAWYRRLRFYLYKAYRFSLSKEGGFSVRCVRDY